MNAVELLKGDMESFPSVAETTASKPSVSALCAPQHAPVFLESEPPRLQAPACQPVHSLQDPSCDAFSPSSESTKYLSGPKGKGKAPPPSPRTPVPRLTPSPVLPIRPTNPVTPFIAAGKSNSSSSVDEFKKFCSGGRITKTYVPQELIVPSCSPQSERPTVHGKQPVLSTTSTPQPTKKQNSPKKVHPMRTEHH